MFIKLATLAIASIFGFFSLAQQPVGAQSISSSRDCDSNAVIRCGALSVNELQRKYGQSNAHVIFSHFGISRSDVMAMDSTSRAGVVTKSGEVKVNGKTVATGAMTAGRHNMPGSQKVSRGSATFYMRPPSVSFASSSLSSFVVMKNGEFKYAVIASCGNPVKAKPVKKIIIEKPVVKEKVIEKEVIKEVPVVKERVVEREVPQELPAAGASGAVAFGAIATIGAALAHNLYIRRNS